MSPGLRRAGFRLLTAGVVLYTLFPVAWIVSLSFKTGGQLTDGRFLPARPGLENYRIVFGSELFTSALRNSVGIASITTVIAITLASGAAYALVRLEFPFKRAVLGGALGVAMFPQVALVGPLFDLWRGLGLYDTWAGLVLPYLSFSLPLALWTLTAYFKELPWELEQAARMDGATRWQAFHKVMLPLAAPGIFTAAILTFFFAWNDFLFGISLTSSEAARPAPAALAFFSGQSQFQQPYGAIAAAAVVVTVPVVILVLVFQRRIVAGLTSGAVKG